MLAWFERHPTTADVVLAFVALIVFGTADFFRDGASGALIDIVFALAIVFWRRMPGLGLAVAWVGAGVQILTLDGLLAGDILILGAVFATGLTENRAVRWAGLTSSIVGGVVAGTRLIVFTTPASSDGALIPTDEFYRAVFFVIVSGVVAAALTLFWALGVLVRNRRAAALIRAARERDRIYAFATLTEERERALLSREMHDLIGHALAVVIAQSDGARYAKATDPLAETSALETINRTARSALDDVHELLSVLRDPRDASAASTRSSVSTAGDLELLAASVREAGVDVQITQTGTAPVMSAAHDLTVYRVLQESLTNAMKHGGRGTVAQVTLDWQQNHLVFGVSTIEPVSTRRTPPRAGGQGLIGMSERVRLLDGTVEAGARTDGTPGFRVVARLPYRVDGPST